jgi:hypothetical protein
VDRANEISEFIEAVGIPVAVALFFGLGLWWLIKYILTSIVTKISEAQKKTEDNIKDLKVITISLIEKSQSLQGDLIRLDTMLRVKYGLAPDEARIGRALDYGKRDRPENK